MARFPLILWVGAVLLAGCGSSPPNPPVPPERSVGVYDFTATIPFRTGAITLDGYFEITQDTVLLTVYNAHCRERQGSISGFAYDCSSAAFTDVSGIYVGFDRRQPLLYCGASATRSIPVEKQVCAQYMITKEGQRVCISWMTETTYETERRSAPLLVTRRKWGAP